MSDILDLDALAPQAKKIKINGKVIDCNPPTIKQLLNLQRTVNEIQQSNVSADEAMSRLEDALSRIIPSLATDKDIDFTLGQFYALIEFLQKDAIPQSATKAQAYPVQKKTNSVEQ